MRKTILLVLLAIFLIGCSSKDTPTEAATPTGGAIAENIAITCEDSDNGITPNTAAKVTGVDAEGKEYLIYDRCGNMEIVSEYYCEDSKPLSKNVRCAT